MTNPFTSIEASVTQLFTGVAKSVGTTAAKAAAANPMVTDALGDLEARLDKAQAVAMAAAAVAGVVVLFYFVPRFESPVPRIFRKTRR